MDMDNKYSEWRVLTPILLAVIVLAGGVTSYLVVDKLNTMNSKSNSTFDLITQVKTSFDDYRVTAEGRFSHIETELADFNPKK